MKSIGYKIDRINLISDKFEKLNIDLKNNQEIIVRIFKDLVDKYAQEFNLTKTNSVRKLNFYSFVYRIKEKKSFAEKLIRNNDYNLFDSELEDLANINDLQLETKIKELDDLIGIKILTDLNVDSINMFELVKSSKFLKELKDQGITINNQDLSNQPVTMKNGLNIFKFRCTYETWKFELQIKSKLESAWGDMEHSIFYKDYKFTPVRDLAQQSMVHIGKLLVEIDGFLEEVRNANDNFSDNSKTILFSNNFETNYSSHVSNILQGISYNFKKITTLCFYIQSSGLNIFNAKIINSEYLSLNCHKYKSYIDFRNMDFDLQIFETIIVANIDSNIDNNSLAATLDKYFEYLKKSYIIVIIQNNTLFDEEIVASYVDLFFQTCINTECKDFILNTSKIIEHIENMKLFTEGIEVLELSIDQKNELLALYTVFCFKGNLHTHIANSDKDQLLENLEKARIELSKITVVKNLIPENLSTIINIIG